MIMYCTHMYIMYTLTVAELNPGLHGPGPGHQKNFNSKTCVNCLLTIENIVKTIEMQAQSRQLNSFFFAFRIIFGVFSIIIFFVGPGINLDPAPPLYTNQKDCSVVS